MEKTKFFIDSSFIVALFKNFDSNHDKAKLISEQLFTLSSELIISDFVFSESLTILSQKVGKEIALKLQDFLLDRQIFRIIYLDEILIMKSKEIFSQAKSKNMSFADCTSLAIIEYETIKNFVTFDKTDFKKYEWKYRFKIIS